MKTIGITLLLLSLTACAGQFQGIGSIGQLDLQNAIETRKLARDLLSTWRLNSGFIRGTLGPKLQELPASIVMAMDELDKLALKDPSQWDDFDLGYSLGVRVRMLSAIIQNALKLYAPEVLQFVPGVLGL